MKNQKLETYRKEDLAKSSFYNVSTGQLLEFTVHERATQSFYLSLQSLEQLENATYAYPPGQTSAISVASWFISIESLINNILKIASLSYADIDFESLKGQSIGTRFGKVVDILEIEKKELGKIGLYAEIEEFKYFRNEMFHDRTYEKPLVFHKTLFSSSATELNQIDVIQTFQIFLKLSQVLRYSITGLDLVPSILVNRDGKVFYSKLDKLYDRMVANAFNDVLKKHRLETDLNLQISASQQAWVAKPIRGWQICIKHQTKFEGHTPNLQKTTILSVEATT